MIEGLLGIGLGSAGTWLAIELLPFVTISIDFALTLPW